MTKGYLKSCPDYGTEVQGYHAHVYFTPATRGQAATLRAQIAGAGIPLRYVGRLRDKIVGPHATGMFEFHFDSDHRPAWRGFLQVHRGLLTALVHEVTGNDIHDHLEGAEWLGEALPLDISKLDPPPGEPAPPLNALS